MKVRFTSAYDYTPSRKHQVTIAYPAGWRGTVKRECGDAAIAAGKAERLDDAEDRADDEAASEA